MFPHSTSKLMSSSIKHLKTVADKCFVVFFWKSNTSAEQTHLIFLLTNITNEDIVKHFVRSEQTFGSSFQQPPWASSLKRFDSRFLSNEESCQPPVCGRKKTWKRLTFMSISASLCWLVQQTGNHMRGRTEYVSVGGCSSGGRACRLVIRRSLVRQCTSKCLWAKQNTEPQIAPDEQVGTLHGSHHHRRVNERSVDWTSAVAGPQLNSNNLFLSILKFSE